MPVSFRLYNTRTRAIEAFVPQTEGQVTLYVCGMTVYDRTHIGHARAMVVFDAFSRWLRHSDWRVRFVRNFTDVDDKIIARANTLGIDPAQLASDEIAAFIRDMTALGLTAPDEQPRVTQTMDAIIGFIGELVDGGHAYEADGNVWFSVSAFEHYGALSGRTVDDMRSKESESESGKRAPADFALWKRAKAGDPQWPSRFGPGRPGWHIECSAMARATLGPTIDIHGGGLDLLFPHHENEIAQSECANAKPYVRYWMHNGLLTMSGGQKMGKSLGNVVNIEDILTTYPAEAVRLYYLQNHYRSPLAWSEQAIDEPLSMLGRLYDAREVAESMQGDDPAQRVVETLGEDAKTVWDRGRAFPEQMQTALCDDFNTAKVVGYLCRLARDINRLKRRKQAMKTAGSVVAPALAAFKLAANAIGLLTMSTEEFVDEVKDKRLATNGLDRVDIENNVARRDALRRARQWADADVLRADLDAKGIVIMDDPQGSRWRVRLGSPTEPSC